MKSDFSISSGSVIASDLHATCPPSAALQALAGVCESARRGGRERRSLLLQRDCHVATLLAMTANGSGKELPELIEKSR